jgi:CRP-like cAMP-binding protein
MIEIDLGTIGSFTDSQLELFHKSLIYRQLYKNDMLLHEGQICSSAFYLVSGSAYQFRYDDIDEKIIDLHLESEWCLNYSSFISQTPSATSLKVNSDCAVMELTLHAVHHLIAVSQAFLQLGKILEGALSRVQYFDNSMSPGQKYNHLVETRPGVLSMFSLKMIASYLKVTPETLSRVRGSY